jgi:glucose repression regulatory protein TUP1
MGRDGDVYIRSVCFSPDNRFLAAGAEDKTVKVSSVSSIIYCISCGM